MDQRDTVLLVEDDVAVSTLVSGLLEVAGYQPVTIADHALIASAVERWQPRCVILDGEVPASGEGRSWDDAVVLRRTHPMLPVVMFTADADALAEAQAGTSERSRAAGFAGSVSKPFVVEEFLGTLRTAMSGSPSSSTPPPALPDLTGQLATDVVRTDFVNAVVHELRQPLSVIRGQMQLARRHIGKDPARVQMSIDLAIAQVDRMNGMIGEVLERSPLASNAFRVEVVTFDVLNAATQAVERHQHAEPARISVGRPAAPTVDVRGDPGCVAQILDNLLDNALKFSAPGAPVSVTVTIADGKAQVRVEDQGVGVPDDELNRLFAPFYRTSRTRQFPGTGLGLHISRQFADRCGGRLWLESSSSTGSVFALALPLAE